MIDKAAAISIKNLFDVYYEIPEYQREYSWRLENWENLFNDLTESDKDYFLGTLICIVDSNTSMQVVDGQQRLTTISILNGSHLIPVEMFGAGTSNNQFGQISDVAFSIKAAIWFKTCPL